MEADPTLRPFLENWSSDDLVELKQRVFGMTLSVSAIHREEASEEESERHRNRITTDTKHLIALCAQACGDENRGVGLADVILEKIGVVLTARETVAEHYEALEGGPSVVTSFLDALEATADRLIEQQRASCWSIRKILDRFRRKK